MVLSTTGSIGSYISSKFVLPAGVGSNINTTVDLQRIKVQNFTGVIIDPDNIEERYQDVITDFSKADVLDEAFSWAATVATSGGAVLITSGASGADDIKLDDFSIQSKADAETKALNYLTSLSKDTPNVFRKQANASLLNLGRAVSFKRSIS